MKNKLFIQEFLLKLDNKIEELQKHKDMDVYHYLKIRDLYLSLIKKYDILV